MAKICRLSGTDRCQHLRKSPLVNAETSSLLSNKLESQISVERPHLQWCFPCHSQQASHSLAVSWCQIVQKAGFDCTASRFFKAPHPRPRRLTRAFRFQRFNKWNHQDRKFVESFWKSVWVLADRKDLPHKAETESELSEPPLFCEN